MFKKTAAAVLLSFPLYVVPMAAHSASGPVVAHGTTPTMGSVLTDGAGKTLYVLLSDSKNADEQKAALAACDKACQDKFTPVATTGRPLGQAVIPGFLGSVKGASGAEQATFRGWPLYTFADDTAKGQVNGQGFKQAAYVISPVGEVNRAAPKAVAQAGAAIAKRPVDTALMPIGQEKYAATCAGCHGANGQGAFGAALAGFARLGEDDAFIKQILIGSGDMPGFAGAMDDREIAAVATYARNSWGNEFGGITPEQVKALR
ncbi:c-type cytochrome [Alcaligenaceae bacterium C4P045]|nr:c-type cytochrome [Alcaligenaceae bacterium C4P045]